MSDYISRDAAKHILSILLVKDAAECACNLVDCVLSADVEPVRHGEWIEDHDYLECPECGVMVMRDFTFFDIGNWNYCPNCGAKMCLEDEENDKYTVFQVEKVETGKEFRLV